MHRNKFYGSHNSIFINSLWLGDSMKIGIATLFTKNLDELKALVLPHNQEYADKHQYKLHCFTNVLDNRPPSWSKILILMSLLSQYDWMMWIDADAIFTNFETKIGDFIISHEDSDLIIEKDDQNINAGVFLIKNCPESFEFLAEVYSQTPFILHQWWEQAAIIHLIDYKKQKVGVHVRDSRDTAFGQARDNLQPSINGRKNNWIANYDFVFHAAGLGMTERLSLMRRAIKMVKK